MATLPPGPPPSPHAGGRCEPTATQPHQARTLAESFGIDPDRYHRTRPRYPDAMVQRILQSAPGHDVLDVGIGTGLSARPFLAAGCRVLGVDVDERMAEFARRAGFEVEVGTFEDWDPAGRSFDLVIAGQSWHWVDPALGATKAAEALRPSGRLALFWNVFQPPAALGEQFAEVYRRLLPGTPFAAGAFGGIAGYSSGFARTADGIRAAGGFGDPEQWRFDWTQHYSRDEWLDLVPTAGGHSSFPPAVLRDLLSGLGSAIDAAGGSFTMGYATIVVTAVRR